MGLLDWNPAPSERTYYRSARDGQRAYLVRRGGKDMMRLDREMEEILHPVDLANMHEWRPDNQVHPINTHQLAQVAFAADRELCRVLGKPVEARREWLSMKEQDRVKWMQDGPDTGDIRDDLYDAIQGTLGSLLNG